METVMALVALAFAVLYFMEKEQNKKLEAQVRILVKRRDYDDSAKAMEPLQDYVPEPIPDYMLEHVGRDESPIEPGRVTADTFDTRSSGGGTLGPKKTH